IEESAATNHHGGTGDDIGHGIAHGPGGGGGDGSGGEDSSSANTVARSIQEGNMSILSSSSSPSPSSSSRAFPEEDDELSSDGGKHDHKEGKGVLCDLTKVFTLVRQDQAAQQTTLQGMAEEGGMLERLGRKMAQDAHQALEKGQRNK
ncbi:unnamed protein product, partial [Laminaria digitata]